MRSAGSKGASRGVREGTRLALTDDGSRPGGAFRDLRMARIRTAGPATLWSRSSRGRDASVGARAGGPAGELGADRCGGRLGGLGAGGSDPGTERFDACGIDVSRHGPSMTRGATPAPAMTRRACVSGSWYEFDCCASRPLRTFKLTHYLGVRPIAFGGCPRRAAVGDSPLWPRSPCGSLQVWILTRSKIEDHGATERPCSCTAACIAVEYNRIYCRRGVCCSVSHRESGSVALRGPRSSSVLRIKVVTVRTGAG
jgi:hypothetical protein